MTADTKIIANSQRSGINDLDPRTQSFKGIKQHSYPELRLITNGEYVPTGDFREEGEAKELLERPGELMVIIMVTHFSRSV